MNRIILTFFALLALGLPMSAQEHYFPYPQVPDTMSTLRQRCDYLVTHFWDRCELKKAFSAKAKMAKAFDDYMSFIPYASADTVYASIAHLMKRLEKQPKDQTFIMEQVEKTCYTDTAEYRSDDLFLAFARPYTANKKVDKKDKQRVAQMMTTLENTKLKSKAPVFTYIDRNGERHSSTETLSQMSIIFFVTPDCTECTLDRARLNADIKTTKLITDGILKVFVIYPGDDTEEWKKAAAGYPADWIVGASPGIDKIYDLRQMPSFYLIYGNGRIQAKGINIDALLAFINYKL